MKKIISSICALVLLINIFAPIALANGDTTVAFADEKLKNAIIELGHDTNSDGELSQDEMSTITELDISSKEISNLTGLEYATNLVNLDIDNNSIADLTSIVNLSKLVNKNIGRQYLEFDLGIVKVGDKLELDMPLICKQLNLEPVEPNYNFVGGKFWHMPTLNEEGTKIIYDTSESCIHEKEEKINIYQTVDSSIVHHFGDYYSVGDGTCITITVCYSVVNDAANFEVYTLRCVEDEELEENIAIEGDIVRAYIYMNTEVISFSSANFELAYDNSKLQYVDSWTESVMNDGIMKLINHDSENSVIKMTFVADPNDDKQLHKEGDVACVEFKVIGGKGTEADIDFTVTTLKLKDGTNVPSNITQGKIQVLDAALNKTELNLDRGTEETLNIIAKPDGVDISGQTINWKSSNTNVATVDNNGKVTAKNIGDATITAEINVITVDSDGEWSEKVGVTASCNVNVYASLKSISLNKTETTIHRGNDETLTVIYNPGNTTDDKTVTWTSSEKSVATVDSTGKITAVDAGTTTITANVGGKTATCKVTVDVPLESIALNKTETSLNKEESETLTVTYNPGDTTDDKTVNWTTLNDKVATVDSNGKVTAVGAGTATITANVGGKTATCEVTVYAPLKSISLTKATLSIPQKQFATLGIIYNPTDTTDDKTATWTSSEETVATVDKNGKITAVGTGTTTITASVGGKTATCELTVEGILGDIDKDNMVTAFDAYKALEESIASNKTETTTYALDIDGDGAVTSFDAYKILEKSVGIVDGNYWK